MKRRTFITTAAAMLAVPSIGLSASTVGAPVLLSGQDHTVTQAFDAMQSYGFGLDEQAGGFGYWPGVFDSVAALEQVVHQNVTAYGTTAQYVRATHIVSIRSSLCRDTDNCIRKQTTLLALPQHALAQQSLREVMTTGQTMDLRWADRVVLDGLFRLV